MCKLEIIKVNKIPSPLGYVYAHNGFGLKECKDYVERVLPWEWDGIEGKYVLCESFFEDEE